MIGETETRSDAEEDGGLERAREVVEEEKDEEEESGTFTETMAEETETRLVAERSNARKGL